MNLFIKAVGGVQALLAIALLLSAQSGLAETVSNDQSHEPGGDSSSMKTTCSPMTSDGPYLAVLSFGPEFQSHFVTATWVDVHGQIVKSVSRVGAGTIDAFFVDINFTDAHGGGLVGYRNGLAAFSVTGYMHETPSSVFCN